MSVLICRGGRSFVFRNVDRRRKDRFSYFDDRDAPDGSGEFLLPSVLLRRFAPWFGGLHGGCAWHFWSYAPLLSNITLRQRCVVVGDDRKMVSSGYAEATGLLMGLLCFFTDLGCRVPFKKDWRPDLGVDRLVFRGGNMGVATSSSGYTSLLASIHSFSFPVWV